MSRRHIWSFVCDLIPGFATSDITYLWRDGLMFYYVTFVVSRESDFFEMTIFCPCDCIPARLHKFSRLVYFLGISYLWRDRFCPTRSVILAGRTPERLTISIAGLKKFSVCSLGPLGCCGLHVAGRIHLRVCGHVQYKDSDRTSLRRRCLMDWLYRI